MATINSATSVSSLCKLFFVCMIGYALLGCTQHHSLVPPANPSNKMYGTPAEDGEVIEHQKPASTVFASDLDCDASESQYAPMNFRVGRPTACRPSRIPGSIDSFCDRHDSTGFEGKHP